MNNPAGLTYNADLTPGQISVLAPVSVVCVSISATALILAINEQLNYEEARSEANLLEQIAQGPNSTAQESIGTTDDGFSRLVIEAKELRTNNPPASDTPEYAIGVFGPLFIVAALYAAFKASRLQ